MIVRAWRGYALPTRAQAYVEHFEKNVVPKLHSVSGFLGASLLRTDHGGEVEFLVLTRWASMAAIEAFAGDDVAKAVVEPQAIAALVSFEDTVRHYNVLREVPGAKA